jgi:acetyl-CoA carboxylase carboxyltransferase component
MAIIESKIDPGAERFRAQREGMLALVAELRALEQKAVAASARAKPLFDRRGQLLPRERLARLLDPGAPWLELSSLAGWLADSPDPQKSIPGGGMISGIGTIAGTWWSAFNAVTELVDHGSNQRGQSERERAENRMMANLGMHGRAAAFKSQALEVASQFAGIA